jgi:uncharacterized protein (DUF2141 family)
VSHGENAVSMDLPGRRRIGGTAARAMAGLLALLLLAALAVPVLAQSRGEIRVKVVGLQSDKGELRWALYDKKATFATKDGPLVKGARPIKNGQCEFVIPNVAYGTYAVIVGHDVNRDGSIDENPFSAELKGISNYTSKILWFPNFDKAKFPVNQASVPVEIHVY